MYYNIRDFRTLSLPPTPVNYLGGEFFCCYVEVEARGIVGLTNDANYASICLQIYAKNSFVFAGIPHNLQAFHYLYSGVAKKSEEKVDL